MRETIDYDPIEELVTEGRRALAAGELEHARWCFEEVLSRRADHPRALLGLSYVLRKSNMPPADGGEAIIGADLEVVALVREKRYVDAIALLQRELLVRPNDPTLQKSITHLQSHVRRRTIQKLGGPKARLELADDGMGLGDELRDLLNGERTLDALLEESSLGADETARTLEVLHDAGRILRLDEFGPSNEPPSLPDVPPARASDRPPPPEQDASVVVDPEMADDAKSPNAPMKPTEPMEKRVPLGVPRTDVTDRTAQIRASRQDGAGGRSSALPAIALLLLAAVVIATLLLTRN